MATNPKNQPPPPGPKKPMGDLQKRAEAMTKNRSKPVAPKQFFEEAWIELKKTTWPSREVLTKSTYVVLALVVGVAIWVGIIDTILAPVSNFLFNAHR